MKLGSGVNYSILSKTELSPVFNFQVLQKKFIFRVKSIFISFGGGMNSSGKNIIRCLNTKTNRLMHNLVDHEN